MRYRNGIARVPRVLDSAVRDRATRSEDGYCAVCFRLLPKGPHRRLYCLDHSPYPQMLIRRERRRRGRERAAQLPDRFPRPAVAERAASRTPTRPTPAPALPAVPR
jgi:hypothetical protein